MAAYHEFEYRHLRIVMGVKCQQCQTEGVTQIFLIGSSKAVLVDSACASQECNGDTASPLGRMRQLTKGIYLPSEPFILKNEEHCESCGLETTLQFFRNGALVASECLNDRCSAVRTPTVVYILPPSEEERKSAPYAKDAELIPDEEVISLEPEKESA